MSVGDEATGGPPDLEEIIPDMVIPDSICTAERGGIAGEVGEGTSVGTGMPVGDEGAGAEALRRADSTCEDDAALTGGTKVGTSSLPGAVAVWACVGVIVGTAVGTSPEPVTAGELRGLSCGTSVGTGRSVGEDGARTDRLLNGCVEPACDPEPLGTSPIAVGGKAVGTSSGTAVGTSSVTPTSASPVGTTVGAAVGTVVGASLDPAVGTTASASMPVGMGTSVGDEGPSPLLCERRPGALSG